MRNCFYILLLLVIGASLGLSQNTGWITETAYRGFFPREKCKQVRKVAYDDRLVNRRTREKDRLVSGEVEFDSLGRPIRCASKDWKLNPERLPFESTFAYKENQVIQYDSGQSFTGEMVEFPDPQYFYTGDRLDSIHRDYVPHSKENTYFIWNEDGRLSMVICNRIYHQPYHKTNIIRDTVSYTYDAQGRVQRETYRYNAWDYEYLTADSIVIRGNPYYGMDIAIKFNAQGLPEYMTAMTRPHGNRRQKPISRVVFTYEWR